MRVGHYGGGDTGYLCGILTRTVEDHHPSCAALTMLTLWSQCQEKVKYYISGNHSSYCLVKIVLRQKYSIHFGLTYLVCSYEPVNR